MTSFEYKINDAMGLHARPVGIMVKALQAYKEAEITIKIGDKKADAKRMFQIMALAVKQGETITVEISGKEEEKIAEEILNIFIAEKL